ncbi:MAG: hypothetical protein M3376_12090 [Actinomycetota bacterium]|nr:hypothetical protein [Actinomycetota bacterium]
MTAAIASRGAAGRHAGCSVPRIAQVRTSLLSVHSHRTRLEALDTRPERQLGRRLHLRVKAADARDDGRPVRGRHALGKPLAPDAPGEDGLPGQLGGHART